MIRFDQDPRLQVVGFDLGRPVVRQDPRDGEQPLTGDAGRGAAEQILRHLRHVRDILSVLLLQYQLLF
mgnify:CR=1 FL=1